MQVAIAICVKIYTNIPNDIAQTYNQIIEIIAHKFIVNCLDDYNALNCGKYANCLSHEIISSDVSQKYYDAALE